MKHKNGLDQYRNLVAGVDTKVPLIDGRMVTAINFDNAATTPPFISVLKEIMDFSPWYSSIHRGTGYKSKLSSHMYEISREVIGAFVNADPDYHTVIFVKNATEAINKLSYRLYEENKPSVILSTDMEHHSNDLPWRKKYEIDYVAIDDQGRLVLKDLETKLAKYNGMVKLITVTGASNVTGHINPVHKAAVLAHKYGAKILVDGAQLIPHVPFDMKPPDSPEHIDFLAFSAHKMYAPFGTGVLIGPRKVFEKGEPDYMGGGTVDVVTHWSVKWAPPPHKDEAGTPNIMGVIALAAAVRTLKSIGMEKIREHETDLTRYTIHKLSQIPGIQLYGDNENLENRVAIIPFNIKGLPHDLVAAALSYEAGIAVRSGCFCAQPYIQKLLKLSKEDIEKRISDVTARHPGMVRLSFGLYNQKAEIDILAQKLQEISNNKQQYISKYKLV